MQRIHSKNTGLEKLLRSALHRKGLRYRLHPDLPGHPDLAFVAAKVVVFVDSCFWHCCPRHGTHPAGNSEFWELKFSKTKARDAARVRIYKRSEWMLIRIWEHDMKRNLEECVAKIEEAVRSRRS